MKKAIRSFLIPFLCILYIPSLAASPTNADLILEEAHLFGESRFISMKAQMVIHTASGEKTRDIEVNISNDEEQNKVYMHIISPSFLRNMKFLQHNQKDGSTLQWIATSRGARKITSSGTDERIFDSDFTAADFSAMDTKAYRIINFTETEKSNRLYYRYELLSLNNSDSITRKIVLLHYETNLIYRVEYFSDNKMIKQYQVVDTQSINGQLFPEKSIMKNVITGSYTQLNFQQIEMPSSIPDRIFHYRNL